MATKKFQTLNAYYNYINKQLESCMKEVGRQLRDEMKDYLFQKWYKAYTPEEYNRSFNLLDSIEFELLKTGSTIAVKVGYNTDLIKPEYDEYSYWNQHMSMDGQDVSDVLPYYIEFGNGKNLYYRYDGIGVLEYMRKYMEDNATVKLATLLHLKGIKIG